MFWRTGNSEYELVKRARRQDSAAIKSLYDKYVQYLAAGAGVIYHPKMMSRTCSRTVS